MKRKGEKTEPLLRENAKQETTMQRNAGAGRNGSAPVEENAESGRWQILSTHRRAACPVLTALCGKEGVKMLNTTSDNKIIASHLMTLL